jgi:carbon-monoxide dehydrogenase medium subunit
MLVALRSRRQIAPFSVHRPDTVAEALKLRSASGPSAFLAGGIDLIDWLKFGHPIERLIRLDGVVGLADITGGHAQLRIGAMATHAAIAESAVLQSVLPDLALLWHGVANPRVRFTGTIGGNVMTGRADYDGLPALLALGAKAEIAGGDLVTLDRLSMLEQPLVTGFVIANPGTLRLFTDRTLRPAMSVWVGLTVEANRVRTVRVAVSMAHPSPACVTLPLDVPITRLGHEAAVIAAETIRLMPSPAADGRASAAYRRRMIGVLTKRILIRAGDSA